MTDERLRELLRASHEQDAAPGFAATMRGARAAENAEAPPRRTRPLLAAGAAAAGLVLLAWMLVRDREPAAAPVLVAPALEIPGPFDQLPSPFPGLAVADLTLDGAGQPPVLEGLPIEDPW